MADNQTENLGKYARRHPLRMASTALLIGLGSGWMASRMRKSGRDTDRSLEQDF